MYDQVHTGSYEEAAGCQVIGIQSAEGLLSPTVSYIPLKDGAEVQTTASSGLAGTIYGQVTKYTDLGDGSFRVAVHSISEGVDGQDAVTALRGCVSE